MIWVASCPEYSISWYQCCLFPRIYQSFFCHEISMWCCGKSHDYYHAVLYELVIIRLFLHALKLFCNEHIILCIKCSDLLVTRFISKRYEFMSDILHFKHFYFRKRSKYTYADVHQKQNMKVKRISNDFEGWITKCALARYKFKHCQTGCSYFYISVQIELRRVLLTAN